MLSNLLNILAALIRLVNIKENWKVCALLFHRGNTGAERLRRLWKEEHEVLSRGGGDEELLSHLVRQVYRTSSKEEPIT